MTPHLRVRLRGTLEPPGDKSVGHRLALLSALARGRSRLENFPPGQDCGSTLGVVRALGVTAAESESSIEIEGVGLQGLVAPNGALDAGNSGSTARMACGLLAPQSFTSRIVGDESLSRRPFDRVIRPLTLMGAAIDSSEGRLPVTIHGGQELRGIDYEPPVPSAQVKTAVLFAGLFANGRTRIRETFPTRDHTEIALRGYGVEVEAADRGVSLHDGGQELTAGRFTVPGDFSSAAFFITAAAFLPGSELVVTNVGLNPTRTGLLEVLQQMGANIELEAREAATGEEPIGSVRVRGTRLRGARVGPEKLPSMIDEVPVLAVAAAFADGTTTVEGASELRVKESDRLAAIVSGLAALGADVESSDDGFVVRGGRELRAAALQSFGDHRMVMAWAVASLGVDGDCTIDHLDQVNISYPGFWETLDRLVR